MMPMFPSTLLGWLALLAIAAPVIQLALARWLPEWTSAGYAVLVTSDHGMDDDGRHNDNSEASRRVPLWLAGEGFKNTPLPADQTQIAGLVCRALGIE